MTEKPRILIVEDELLVAMDLEATLADQGWQVLGPVPDVRRALALLEHETPDAACLDMNLNGGSSAPIAAVLQQRQVPFVILTGYTGKHVSDPAFQDAPLVNKPFFSEELVQTITRLLPDATAHREPDPAAGG